MLGLFLKIRIPLFFLWIFGFSNEITFASHAGPKPKSRPQSEVPCPGYDSNDPFAINLRYSKGPRRGECVRLQEMRPIHILSKEEAESYALKANLPPPAPGEVWVANIRHNNKFWVAKLTDESVEDILFQVERFDPKGPLLARINSRTWFAAHAQVRFKFKKGKEALLIPQLNNDDTPAIKLSNLVVSSEAIRRKNEDFDPREGNQDTYALAKRVLSLEQVTQDSVKKLGHEIAQFPIRIPGNKATHDRKRQNYLINALNRSEKDYQTYAAHKPKMYNTFDCNCISDAIDIFDDITDYRSVSRSEEEIPELLPGRIVKSLERRGLIFSTSRQAYPTLNQEVGIPWRF